MKGLGFWLVLLVPGLLHAQQASDTSEEHSAQHSARREFVSGGTIRLHLEAGGYTIRPGDSENVVVDCDGPSEEQLKRVKVEIKRTGATADVTFPKLRIIISRPPSRFRAVPIFGSDCRRENWSSKMLKAIRMFEFLRAAFKSTFPTLSCTVTAMLL
jgi:hypothetical protein